MPWVRTALRRVGLAAKDTPAATSGLGRFRRITFRIMDITDRGAGLT